jgi:acetyl esterase/lipase
MASYAAEVVEVPAVWLTPLVGEPEVREGIRPPALLVGGTADELWNGVAARALGVQVLELNGVGHGLVVQGDPHASLDAMRRIVDAVADFA